MQLLMAANWKMNKTRAEAVDTLNRLDTLLSNLGADRECVVFAPFTALAACAETLGGNGSTARISLGGQNCYPAKDGAFTGECSPAMLLDAGCAWVLTGHSERRAILGESDAFIGKKTAFALENGLKVVFCTGETLEERDSGQLAAVLERQMREGLAGVGDAISAPRLPELLAVAYEPVWAIGTGRVAGPKEIVEAHTLVRSFLNQRFPAQGKDLRILYGGSVKSENAGEIIRLDNVNGVLVGGASLQAESFSRIALA
jgi:triosephosphate isomerase